MVGLQRQRGPTSSGIRRQSMLTPVAVTSCCLTFGNDKCWGSPRALKAAQLRGQIINTCVSAHPPDPGNAAAEVSQGRDRPPSLPPHRHRPCRVSQRHNPTCRTAAAAAAAGGGSRRGGRPLPCRPARFMTLFARAFIHNIIYTAGRTETGERRRRAASRPGGREGGRGRRIDRARRPQGRPGASRGDRRAAD